MHAGLVPSCSTFQVYDQTGMIAWAMQQVLGRNASERQLRMSVAAFHLMRVCPAGIRHTSLPNVSRTSSSTTASTGTRPPRSPQPITQKATLQMTIALTTVHSCTIHAGHGSLLVLIQWLSQWLLIPHPHPTVNSRMKLIMLLPRPLSNSSLGTSTLR